MQTYRFMDVSMACQPASRIASGGHRHDVAIFPGPDNLWIELNEVHEPPDAQWFPA